MSLGGPGGPDDPLSQAADNAVDLGVVVVAAAGNSGPEGDFACGHADFSICSPGTSEKAITIGSSHNNKDDPDKISDFSSRGPVGRWIKPDIVAPGEPICSSKADVDGVFSYCLDHDHILLQGTSMATPHVSGAAALIKQAHPDWTSEDIKSALISTAIDMGFGPNEQGSGRIDALRSVQLIDKPPIAIINPTEEVVSGEVDITGWASSSNFNNYVIGIGRGYNPTEWGTTGISLINDGLFEVKNSTLAIWDTSSVEDGIWTIRLTTTDIYNISNKDYLMVAVNWYWPQIIGGGIGGSATIADVDDDGELEIIAGVARGEEYDYTGAIYVWEHTGALSQIIPLEKQHQIFYSSPAIGDIDNDGDFEIVVGAENADVSINDTYLYAFHHDGSLIGGFPVVIGSSMKSLFIYWESLATISSPILDDLNANGKLEIIVLANNSMYIFHDDGSIVNGWPHIWYPSHPAVGDLDGDGDKEIIYSKEGIGKDDKIVYALHHNGSEVEGWPVEIELEHNWLMYPSTPVIGDVDYDGDLEVFIAAIRTHAATPLFLEVYGWHHNGSLIEGLPVIVNNSEYEEYKFEIGTGNIFNYVHQPILADLDGHAGLEIMVNLEISSRASGLFAWHHSGVPVEGWPQIVFGEDPRIGDIGLTGQPIVSDIDDDGGMEVILTGDARNQYVYIWHHNGSEVEGWPKETGDCRYSTPSLKDINNDGKIEVVITTIPGIYVLHLNSTYNFNNIEWDEYRYNEKHTALYNKSTSKDTTPPIISDIKNTSITDHSAIITWTTDEVSDSIVKYGTSPGEYTLVVSNATYVKTHQIKLIDLIPNATYYYVANSTDQTRNSAESTEYSFTTKPLPARNYTKKIVDDFRVDQENTNKGQSSLTMDIHGNLMITWSDYDLDGRYARIFDNTGAPYCDSFIITNEIVSISATSFSNRFVVTWDSSYYGEIYMRIYDTSCNPITDSITVKSDIWGVDDLSINSFSNGLVVVWEKSGIHARIFNSTGYALSGTFRVDQSRDYTFFPSVGIDSNDNIVVAWVEGSSGLEATFIYARIFNSTGQALGDAFRVDHVHADKSKPSIALDSEDNIFILWLDDTKYLRARIFNSSGDAIADVFFIERSSSEKGNYSIEIDPNDTVIVAWEGDNDNRIYIRKFYNNGTAMDDTSLVYSVSSGKLRLSTKSLVSTSDRFILVWGYTRAGNKSGVYYQVFNTSDAPLGDVVILAKNLSRHSDYFYQQIAIDSNEEFVITWSNEDESEVYEEIHANKWSMITPSCHIGEKGGWSYCIGCKCEMGEGDCDSNDECKNGTVCLEDVGDIFGWDPEVDVCYSNITLKNLISNPGFEDGGDSDFPRRFSYLSRNIPLDTWVFTYLVRRIDTDAHTGVRSVKITDQRTDREQSVFQMVQVEPNTSYKLSAWGKNDSEQPASKTFIMMYFLDSEKKRTGGFISSYGFESGQWTLENISATSPSDAEYVKVVIGIGRYGTGVLYVDDVVLVEE